MEASGAQQAGAKLFPRSGRSQVSAERERERERESGHRLANSATPRLSAAPGPSLVVAGAQLERPDAHLTHLRRARRSLSRSAGRLLARRS